MRIHITVLLVAIASGLCTGCSLTEPCAPLRGGSTLEKPPQEHSSNGRMHTSLKVAISEFTLDWLTSHRRLYNGMFPGPTLYWKPGDIVNLDLINTMSEPEYEGEPNTLRFPNTTNIHTHGLHISSEEPQDNVMVQVLPGQTYNYQYHVHPQQSAGTYFYHPHKHGSAYFQNLGGMAGMLIIEDDPLTMSSKLDAVSCPNNCDNEVPMVFQLFQYRNDEDGSFSVAQQDIHDNHKFRLNSVLVDNSSQTLEEWLEDPVHDIQYMLVNGQLHPVMEMKPGEMKRFRLLNAAGVYALALHIVSSGSSSCVVKEIALDGHYLDQPRDVRLGRSLLVAASRVDWLVMCEDPGDYQLQSTFSSEDEVSMGDHPSFNGNLLTIRVRGALRQPAEFPEILPRRADFERDLRDVNEDVVCGRFAVEVTPTDSLNREDATGRSIRYKAEVGTIQEWYLTNTEYVTSHPIHIHVNTFQVISYNKYTGPYGVDDGERSWKLFSQNGETCTWQHSNYDRTVSISSPSDALQHIGHETRQKQGGVGTIGYAQVGEWRDTILVPPLSNITIRFKTDSHTGRVVVHCHLLADADQGMSLITAIVDKGTSLEANATSAGAYQWSCMENQPIAVPTCNP